MVTLKGRVAATIQSADELVLTELIFNSGFKVCPAACILAPHALKAVLFCQDHKHFACA